MSVRDGDLVLVKDLVADLDGITERDGEMVLEPEDVNDLVRLRVGVTDLDDVADFVIERLSTCEGGKLKRQLARDLQVEGTTRSRPA